MKICSYYGCVEQAETNDTGFVYCIDHLAYLHRMIELDDEDDTEDYNTIAYCLASLNCKAYNRQGNIL